MSDLSLSRSLVYLPTVTTTVFRRTPCLPNLFPSSSKYFLAWFAPKFKDHFSSDLYRLSPDHLSCNIHALLTLHTLHTHTYLTSLFFSYWLTTRVYLTHWSPAVLFSGKSNLTKTSHPPGVRNPSRCSCASALFSRIFYTTSWVSLSISSHDPLDFGARITTPSASTNYVV